MGTASANSGKPPGQRAATSSNKVTAAGADDKVRVAKTARRRKPADPPEGLETRIQIEAYLLAERRGFQPGGELEDWLEAERIVSSKRPQAG